MRTPVVATLLGVALALPAFAEEPPARTITARGTATVSARPDAADIRMVVFTEAALASSALEDNNVMTESLLKRLAELGIARKDVYSRRSAVRPQFSQSTDGLTRPEVIGYHVRNNVRARVRRLDKLGTILDDLANKGPDLIQNVQLVVGDPAGLYEIARKQALADARRRAEQFARDAGLQLGELQDIREEAPDQTQAGDSSGEDDEQYFQASVSVTYAATKHRSVETAPDRKPPARPAPKD
jgi:uncharacterized protein YggE